MKRPKFLEGVVVAFAASAAGGVLFTVLGAVLPSALLLRLLIAGLGLGYVLYLLKRSRDRIGGITTLAAWAMLAGATWFMQPSLPAYLLVHVGALWLIRSLYFYSSVLAALADLGLNALSLIAVVWAVQQTGSVFLGIWCFFLVQALFVAIPPHLAAKEARTGRGRGPFPEGLLRRRVGAAQSHLCPLNPKKEPNDENEDRCTDIVYLNRGRRRAVSLHPERRRGRAAHSAARGPAGQRANEDRGGPD